MLFELTELLTCPRCGPTVGLILLVEELSERRVHRGWLGCPKCHHDYPVREGVADLRLTPESSVGPPAPPDEGDLPVKIAALSGLSEGPGYVLIDARLAHVAAEVTDLLPEFEVIAFGMAPEGPSERQGVSWILADSYFPLVLYRLRAAAIAPGGDGALVAAAARVVGPGGRLVLFDATETDNAAVRESGLEVIACDGGTTVAERKDPFAPSEP